MHNEWFWHMQKLLQNDISFFLNKVQMEQAKMNLNFSFTVYSHITTLNVKDKYNIINNQ